MITEDYVSFELAELLKYNGFDVPVKSYFENKEQNEDVELYSSENINWNSTDFYSRPTIQTVIKWLREEKELLVSVNPTIDKDGYVCVMYYIWQLDDIETEAIRSGLYSVESYNKCIESAIIYCLENLINV